MQKVLQSSDWVGELKWNAGASQWLWGQDEAMLLRGSVGKTRGDAYVWEINLGTC